MNHQLPTAFQLRAKSRLASPESSAPTRRSGPAVTLTHAKEITPDRKRGPGDQSVAGIESDGSPIQGESNSSSAKTLPTTVHRSRNRQQRQEYLPVPLENLRWLTVSQASLRFPSFSEKAIRHLVTQAENYARYPKIGLRSNGFLPCVVRPAGQRKIVIDAEKFDAWLKSYAVAH